MHHLAWGCPNNDLVGSSLLHSSSIHDYQLLNSKSPTFLSWPNQNPSSIDLSFASSFLFPLTSWSIGEDNFRSDHFPTHILIRSKPTRSPWLSTRLRSPSIDWPSFLQTISVCFNSLIPSFSSLQSLTSTSPPSPPANFDSLPLPLKYDYLVEAIIFSLNKA